MHSILFLDDERPILRSLHRLFRETDLIIHLADNVKEAFNILEHNHIDLVFSDMRMPNMNGHQFLQIVKEKYPTTMRIILSGYAEEKEIYHAILDGSAKFYLLKPWKNDDLVQIAQNLFTVHDILKEKNLLEQIESFEELPTLPESYHKLCTMIEEENDIKQITAMIEQDPAVAANVLRLANSGFYNIKTASIQQSVSYLGLNVIKQLLLASTIFAFQTDAFNAIATQLWQHAYTTNIISMFLSEKICNKKLSDEFIAAGLLHDIGKIALLSKWKTTYLQILNDSQNQQKKLEMLEMETIGISHREIGAYLLNWWQLPYPLIEAALFHACPLAQPVLNKDITCLVHIADYYSKMTLTNQSEQIEVNPAAFEYLHIDKTQCDHVIATQLNRGGS